MSQLFNKIYQQLKAIESQYTWILILGVGLFCLLIDQRSLIKKKLKREANICKYIGWVYIIGGIGFYIFLNIQNRFF